MDVFQQVQSVAAPLMRANIDTDIIIPSREITSPSREGYGEKLFAPWRYRGDGREENPDFVLNRAPYRHAQILLAGENFGSGSSREMAVWAIRQFGLRCIIAPSFGTIFRNNCYRNGVLPVVLPEASIAQLASLAEREPLVLNVDLETCRVHAPAQDLQFAFDVPASERTMLLQGLDAIALTMQHAARIEAFQDRDRVLRPWVWTR